MRFPVVWVCLMYLYCASTIDARAVRGLKTANCSCQSTQTTGANVLAGGVRRSGLIRPRRSAWTDWVQHVVIASADAFLRDPQLSLAVADVQPLDNSIAKQAKLFVMEFSGKNGELSNGKHNQHTDNANAKQTADDKTESSSHVDYTSDNIYLDDSATIAQQGKKSFQSNQNQGNRYQGGNRNQAYRHQGNRNQAYRQQGNRMQANRYQGNRPQGNRYQGSNYQGNRMPDHIHQDNRFSGSNSQYIDLKTLGRPPTMDEELKAHVQDKIENYVKGLTPPPVYDNYISSAERMSTTEVNANTLGPYETTVRVDNSFAEYTNRQKQLGKTLSGVYIKREITAIKELIKYCLGEEEDIKHDIIKGMDEMEERAQELYWKDKMVSLDDLFDDLARLKSDDKEGKERCFEECLNAALPSPILRDLTRRLMHMFTRRKSIESRLKILVTKCSHKLGQVEMKILLRLRKQNQRWLDDV